MARGKLSNSSHALIGAGHMGGAILNSWVVRGGEDNLNPANILVIDPSPGDTTKKALDLGVKFASQLTKGAASGLKLCLLAVKPQIFDQVSADLHRTLPRDVLVVSIMAGINIERLKRALSPRPVVRAMPNTPAAIGHGITVFVASDDVSPTQTAMVEARFRPMGKVIEIKDESKMDAVTAVSGSGPAYVFYLGETMAAAGMALGLSEDLAHQLARETIVGAGAMLARSDLPMTAMREAVTSPNGTTEAALDVLMGENGMADVMRAAIKTAYMRSKKLAE